jgi:Leucine-rich repeat (LRR) protein
MDIALQRIKLAKETNAISFNLFDLGLKDLPVELFELSSLTQLDVDFNQLVDIPKEIGQLSSLADYI